MKTILLVASLMILVSCGKSGSDSQSKKGKWAQGVGSGKALVAQAESLIELGSYHYEILSNSIDEQRKSSNGVTYICSASLHMGQINGYSVRGSDLFIVQDEKTYLFKREGESKGSILGSWVADERLPEGQVKTKLTFSPDKLSMSVICDFK